MYTWERSETESIDPLVPLLVISTQHMREFPPALYKNTLPEENDISILTTHS